MDPSIPTPSECGDEWDDDWDESIPDDSDSDNNEDSITSTHPRVRGHTHHENSDHRRHPRAQINNSTQQASTTLVASFPQFQRLPLELRLKIFSANMKRPRVLVMDILITNHGDGDLHYRPGSMLPAQTKAVREMMSIDRATREAALRMYPHSFLVNNGRNRVYFNKDRDIIFLAPQTHHDLRRPLEPATTEDFCKDIANLGVETHDIGIESLIDISLINRFPSLKNVFVCYTFLSSIAFRPWDSKSWVERDHAEYCNMNGADDVTNASFVFCWHKAHVQCTMDESCRPLLETYGFCRPLRPEDDYKGRPEEFEHLRERLGTVMKWPLERFYLTDRPNSLLTRVKVVEATPGKSGLKLLSPRSAAAAIAGLL